MAKPLREPPPSSSVAKLFDMEAAARAVATVPAPPSPEPSLPEISRDSKPVKVELLPPVTVQPSFVASPQSTGEPANVDRQFVLTPFTNDAFERLFEVYRHSTRTRLTASHVARALLRGVAHCLDQIEREAKRLGPLKLPSNAKGKEQERDRFEALLADALISGIRRSAAFDPQNE